MPGIAQMGTVEAEEVVVAAVAAAAEVLGDEVDLVQVSDFFFASVNFFKNPLCRT